MNPHRPDTAVTAFFVLLRAGLWEKTPDNLAVFPLTAETWEEVYGEARRQTVTGIVYRGLCHLPDELLPPQSLLLRWVVAVDAIERRNRRMNTTIASLYADLRAEGLNPLMLKGQGVAAFYEQPLLRECGDIDLYFSSHSDSRRAARLLSGDTKRIDCAADDSICYSRNGIEIEHHHRLLYIANPLVRRYLRALEDSRPAAEFHLDVAGAAPIPVPAPLLNLLMLNTHIMKHAFGWGIGLRQLCDMARAYHCLRADIRPEEARALYHKVGIARWSRLLHTFLIRHLGLPAADLPYKDVPCPPRPLMNIVLQGGNFGYYVPDSSRNDVRAFRRKLGTTRSFLRNARFSCTYAPKEAFWTFTNLLAGQVKWGRGIGRQEL